MYKCSGGLADLILLSIKMPRLKDFPYLVCIIAVVVTR